MNKVNKHLKDILPLSEIEGEIIPQRFFIHVYAVIAWGFLLAASIIFLCDHISAFNILFYGEPLRLLLAVVTIPIVIFVVFHFRFSKNSIPWLISFYVALCILLALFTAIIFSFAGIHYIFYPFLFVAAMFGTMAIGAHFANIDLSERKPSLLTYGVGVAIIVLASYFGDLPFFCSFLSFLFVTLIGFFSLNRERLLKITEIKNPANLNFNQRVLIGSFSISFALIKALWTPKMVRHKARYRWFTDFEN
jgi:FtsH-binding integral membrane protein